MAYGQDYSGAARRHFMAASKLHGVASPGERPGCKAVAGYLFGLSGELALKALMRRSGMTPLGSESRRDDPFYAHFPGLKALLRDHASGRRDGELRKIAESPSLFQNWDTDMRYAPNPDIRDAWIDSWRDSAKQLIEQMDAS